MQKGTERKGRFVPAFPGKHWPTAIASGVLLVDHVTYTKDLGNEVLLGSRESDAFGPVISFSKGGADAEHFAEHFSPPNLILAPIDEAWARALLQSTQIHKKYLTEARANHIDQLVQAGFQLSRLAMGFSNFFPRESRYVLKEFEINPIVFDSHGRLCETPSLPK